MFPRFLTAAFLVASLLASAPLVVSTTSSCVAGSFSSTGHTPCTLCAAGSYQPNSGQTSCRLAQTGWYASGSGADGSGATQQIICPEGSYAANQGQAACTPCPAGSHCEGQGMTQPQLCSPGSYSPTPGLAGQCYDCPKGTFVATNGATACCQCCSGFYTDQTAQTHCFDCPVRGAFSPIGSTSASQCSNKAGGGLTQCSMSGDKCPNPGSSPTGGYRRSGMKRDAQCPIGHKSCPLYGSTSRRGYLRGFECVDVRHDLESCGGCVANDSPFGEPTADGGRDCSAIPYVNAVTCSKGRCVIQKCKDGYEVSTDGMNCVPSFTVQTKKRHENM